MNPFRAWCADASATETLNEDRSLDVPYSYCEGCNIVVWKGVTDFDRALEGAFLSSGKHSRDYRLDDDPDPDETGYGT
jgi:hypothetical protein